MVGLACRHAIGRVLTPDEPEHVSREAIYHKDGSPRMDMLTIRHEAQVKKFLVEPFAFIILGCGHELADELQRQVPDRCQYLRVETKNFKAHGTPP